MRNRKITESRRQEKRKVEKTRKTRGSRLGPPCSGICVQTAPRTLPQILTGANARVGDFLEVWVAIIIV